MQRLPAACGAGVDRGHHGRALEMQFIEAAAFERAVFIGWCGNSADFFNSDALIAFLPASLPGCVFGRASSPPSTPTLLIVSAVPEIGGGGGVCHASSMWHQSDGDSGEYG